MVSFIASLWGFSLLKMAQPGSWGDRALTEAHGESGGFRAAIKSLGSNQLQIHQSRLRDPVSSPSGHGLRLNLAKRSHLGGSAKLINDS